MRIVVYIIAYMRGTICLAVGTSVVNKSSKETHSNCVLVGIDIRSSGREGLVCWRGEEAEDGRHLLSWVSADVAEARPGEGSQARSLYCEIVSRGGSLSRFGGGGKKQRG